MKIRLLFCIKKKSRRAEIVMKKKLLSTVCLALLLLLGTAVASADSAEIKFKRSWDGNVMNISAESRVEALYIEFDEEPGTYTLEGASSKSCGENGFLHEYIELGSSASESIKLIFSERPGVRAVYAFGSTDVPARVQKWERPFEASDLLLISSHADDEQLFFAGILPYYTQVAKLRVQVLYATDNNAASGRQHERLDGLWGVGVRAYPTSLGYGDYYSESAEQALAGLKDEGLTLQSVTADIKKVIETCKPQVLVTHDINGEYGHGMHKLIARAVMNIVFDEIDRLSSGTLPDPGAGPSDSARSWLDTNDYLKKIYLHMYPHRQIVLGFMDESFAELEDMTPFQVTQRYGFSCHKSQHWTWFKKWIYGANNQITKASEIKTYNPAYYGLIYTAAGNDSSKDDFFENIKSRDRIEEEAEAARLAEEARKAEEARLAEEARPAEEAKAKAEEKRRSLIMISAAALLVVIITIIVFKSKCRGKHGKH